LSEAASGHALSVADLARDLDSKGVAQFKSPEQAGRRVLKDRQGAAVVADSEKV
jgi:hypothetical protein